MDKNIDAALRQSARAWLNWAKHDVDSLAALLAAERAAAVAEERALREARQKMTLIDPYEHLHSQPATAPRESGALLPKESEHMEAVKDTLWNRSTPLPASPESAVSVGELFVFVVAFALCLLTWAVSR